MKKNGVIMSALYGPKVMRGGREEEARIPFTLHDGEKPGEMVMRIAGGTSVLRKGQWSDWQKVAFNIGLFRKASGMVRFYLASTGDSFSLYATPVNFDPEEPLFSISSPASYSRTAARKYGLYPTLGMPHDTWGLQEGKLSEGAFLDQVEGVLTSRQRILRAELNKFRGGVFFFYFDTLDIVQHMFYRYCDSSSPSFEDNARFREIINGYYEKIDSIVGEVVRSVPADTTVMVLSDHGFSPFRRQVHLNRWLEANGFLALKPGVADSDVMFDSVDWSRTKAYALGFGGIYINRIGRDFYGIVPEILAHAIARELSERLKGFRDPLDGKNIVRNVYASPDIYTGACVDSAPDLYVGFEPGYRASWQTALGGVPAALVEDNARKWSGDHLVDPSCVPGVVFSNKKILKKDPSVLDIAPSVYALFGVRANGMDGKDLFVNDE